MNQMNSFMLLGALLLPIIGAIYGFVSAKKAVDRRDAWRNGILIGLLGPVAWVLWKVYNAITERLGLDSVKNLVVNIVLFVAIGVGAGLLLSRLGSKSDSESGTSGAGIEMDLPTRPRSGAEAVAIGDDSN